MTAQLAVVIGAGAMGIEIARALGENSELLLVDRDEEHLARSVDMMRRDGYRVDTFTCDITVPEEVLSLGNALQSGQSFHTLAHVAGLSPSAGDPHRIMSVDLVGAALVERAFLEAAPSGSAAIFISSLSAHGAKLDAELAEILMDPLAPDFHARIESKLGPDPDPGLAYSLAKWGLNQMCRMRANEWGRRGARIVSLSPGLIASPMGAKEFESQPIKAKLLELTPLGRQGEMSEIANVVQFLSSEKASFITGTDILVDGGVSCIKI